MDNNNVNKNKQLTKTKKIMENSVKSKRFVVRKSLIGKNTVITFTTKKW